MYTEPLVLFLANVQRALTINPFALPEVNLATRMLLENVRLFEDATGLNGVDKEPVEAALAAEIELVNSYGFNPNSPTWLEKAAILVGSLRAVLGALPEWVKALLAILEEFLKMRKEDVLAQV